MRIAVCLPEFKPFQHAMRGEPTNATYLLQRHIVKRLLAHGHSLTYLAQRDLGNNVCTNDWEKPNLAPHTWSNSRWFLLLSKFVWKVQQLLGIPYLNVFSNLRLFDACLQCLAGCDVVYERNGLYRNGIAMACNRLKIPYVLFVEADEILEHDQMGSPITGLLRWSARRMFHYNLQKANCIICVSEPLKNHLINTGHVSAEKVIVFPNGVDVQKFYPDPVEGARVRAALGIKENPLILFVGSFYVWHDVTTLLNAFAQVSPSRPDLRLVLVGDGTMRQAMEQLTADLKINNAVQFIGLIPYDDVPRYVAAADIAVVPYPVMKQGMWLSPLKLFEYMASGRAIIASAVGQVVDVIQDGKNGLLVPPGDATAMANALKKLIDDTALRSRLGRQAREDAVQRYSWERYVSRLESLFAAVIARQPFDRI